MSSNISSIYRHPLQLPVVGIKSVEVPLPIRWLLYLFTFSLAWENYDPFGIAGIFSITKMVGILLALFSLLFWQFILKGYQRIISVWLIVIAAISLSTIINPGNELPYGISMIFSLVQSVLFMWICCACLQDDRVATNVIWSLVMGCAIAAVLMYLEIGTTVQDDGRVTLLGRNANPQATLLGCAAIVCIGLFFRSVRDVGLKRFIALAPLLFLLLGISATGSRGAVIGFLLGNLAWFFQRGSIVRRFWIWFLAAIFFTVAVYVLFSGEVFLERMQKTIEKQDVSTRFEIYTESWNLFVERPVLGWGMNGACEELGYRYNTTSLWTAQHNDFLTLLTSAGIIGTIPWLFATLAIALTAWRGRTGIHGIMPLALMIPVLFAGLTGGGGMSEKITWLVYAFVMTSCVNKEHPKITAKKTQATYTRSEFR
jgi:O-antigen ligase